MHIEKTTYVILLRAIGPATHRLMSMAKWREAAVEAGFAAAETFKATGNMVAEFAGSADEAETRMSEILRGFGLKENVIPIVRRGELLDRLVAANPFTDAQKRISQTGIYFFAATHPDLIWTSTYEGPERLDVIADHLLVDFGRNVAKSSALIRRIDKLCGTSTARNWNTVRGLAELCADRGQTP